MKYILKIKELVKGSFSIKKLIEKVGKKMLKVEKLSYSFPQKDLFHEASFELEEKQHCAFIGASGCGKSTLLNIIMDPDKYMYEGKIEVESKLKIGYVSQFSQLEKMQEATVFEYIGEEFIRLQNEINEICKELETSSDFEHLLEDYQVKLDEFQAIDGDNYQSNISKKINLANLGMQENQLVTQLSGGEFKLVQVIKEMLTSPDLMFMDEPDVFLDFDNINALKNLINSYKGNLLIVTHNRYLLNHCFDKIIHLENKELTEYNGSYIEYNFTLLQNKIETMELAIADTEEIERNRRLVDKYRFTASSYAAPSSGKVLKARVKILERLEARRIQAPYVDIKQPYIEFTTDKVVENTVAVKVENYSVAFDESLLENVNFEIGGTDKIALIGANGSGKTTLLRAIYENKNDAITINENIEMKFLSQLQSEVFQENNTILNEFLNDGLMTNQEVIDYLKEFGFEEEMMSQKINDLSGGEKNILQLAKISLSNANMLLLDEPTSHLDTYSQMALEKAIDSYQGAILMISHDFYTIVNCMDYVFIIEDKGIRKMSMRKFRKGIYAHHFDRDYLEIEKNKKKIETKIELALKDNNFILAQELSLELEEIIKLL